MKNNIQKRCIIKKYFFRFFWYYLYFFLFIYTSEYSINILIKKTKTYYFIYCINFKDIEDLDVSSREFVIQYLNQLLMSSKNKRNFYFSTRGETFSKAQTGYIGVIPEIIRNELEVLLEQESWYKSKV